MLFYKFFHIISLISWFAGLFYLPRLFVYHAMTKSTDCSNMLKIMERKLFYYIMYPAMLSTFFFGFLLLEGSGFFYSQWMQVKILLSFFLFLFHLYLGRIVSIFYRNKNISSHKFYRFVNEIPTILLIFIVFLVVIKPF